MNKILYMYSNLLEEDEKGNVDIGFGKKVAGGEAGITKPTKTI